MKSPPSIIFIIPYFGQWPFWMPFFIESCRANPDINWLLISDCEALPSLPRNVELRKSSFVEYCVWVSSRLGFKFAPSNPYKLCDLKPAYGYLHEQDITGYDYWGFSDLDLIYGNLRAYFTDVRLNKFKFFSTHERRVSGHLCLVRNEPELRELFWRIRDFKVRIQDPKNHALDEGGFTRLFLWRKNFPKPLFKFVGLFNRLRRVAEFEEAFSTPNGVRAWTDGTQVYPIYWQWQDGRLTNGKDGDREFPYLHFLHLKKNAWKSIELPTSKALVELSRTNYWVISESGFQGALANYGK